MTATKSLIPPTYKDLARIDPETGRIEFDPEWLNWFIKIRQLIDAGTQGPPGADGAPGPALAFSGGGDENNDLPSFGLMGPIGPAGSQGPAGSILFFPPEPPEPADVIPGPRGNDGSTGAKGDTGAAIALLLDGANEPTDWVPMVGPAGPGGAAGSAGPQGLQGNDGPATWMLVPEPDTPELIPIPGPQGNQGATGPQGNQGNDGPATWLLVPEPDLPELIPIPGPTGPAGTAGSSGAQGSVGAALWTLIPDAEPSEPMPFPGPAGPTGATGTTGAQGSVGPSTWTLADQFYETEMPFVPAIPNPPTVIKSLSAATTVFVATTGNDANDGLSSGSSLLTIQKAINIVRSWNLNGFAVTIQVADGTYTGAIVVNGPWIGGPASGSPVVLQGNVATPANVIVNVTGDALTLKRGALLSINSFEIISSANGVRVEDNSFLIVGVGMVFGACTSAHISAYSGRVSLFSNYSIVGAAPIHFQAFYGARVLGGTNTITLTGTPAFSTAFALADGASLLAIESATFSGTATGVRYSSTQNSVINSGGGGANYFPGGTAGTTATGGIYV